MTGSHGWHPNSTCGSRCLPPAGSEPEVSALHRAARAAALAATLAAALPLAAVLPLLSAATRAAVTRRWARTALAATGVRLNARPLPPGRGRLVVANHISWVDALALLAVGPVRLVAKREVAGLPLIGSLARRIGTVFIDRERLRRLPDAVAAVAAELRRGSDVAAFPEGTSWCGRHAGRWYPAVFQAAVDAGAEVWPLRLTYVGPAGGRSTLAAFVGDELLLPSLWRVLGARGLTLHVVGLPPVRAGAGGTHRAATRRALAAVAAWTVRRAAAPLPRCHTRRPARGEPVHA